MQNRRAEQQIKLAEHGPLRACFCNRTHLSPMTLATACGNHEGVLREEDMHQCSFELVYDDPRHLLYPSGYNILA
ncbi:hypothetical protein HN011_002453 [Eciton burchellii]|nr:hypothetical protein HN011_002453 [Eciton burchellii]